MSKVRPPNSATKGGFVTQCSVLALLTVLVGYCVLRELDKDGVDHARNISSERINESCLACFDSSAKVAGSHEPLSNQEIAQAEFRKEGVRAEGREFFSQDEGSLSPYAYNNYRLVDDVREPIRRTGRIAQKGSVVFIEGNQVATILHAGLGEVVKGEEVCRMRTTPHEFNFDQVTFRVSDAAALVGEFDRVRMM